MKNSIKNIIYFVSKDQPAKIDDFCVAQVKDQLMGREIKFNLDETLLFLNYLKDISSDESGINENDFSFELDDQLLCDYIATSTCELIGEMKENLKEVYACFDILEEYVMNYNHPYIAIIDEYGFADMVPFGNFLRYSPQGQWFVLGSDTY